MCDENLKKKLKENIIEIFIDNNKKEDSDDEPSNKKKKVAHNEDPDDSLKFFKSLRPTRTTATKSSASTSNSVASKPPKKTRTRKTKTKSIQPDIRKALAKHEFSVHSVINDYCKDDNVDPYEMQLALALSESLKDQNQPSTSTASSSTAKTDVKQLENPFSNAGKINSVKTLLERYGFQSKKIYTDYEMEMIMNSKASKRSKYQKLPTLLTNTSAERRNSMIKSRIDEILKEKFQNYSYSQNDIISENFQPYSAYLQSYTSYANTAFEKQKLVPKTDEILHKFYVEDLFEMSFVKPGHLLKDYNSIVGRDPSPVREIVKTPDKNLSDDNHSCSDIFEDIESFSIDLTDSKALEGDEDNVLSDQLNIINDKLSQEPENDDHLEVISIKTNDDSDATIEYSINEKKSIKNDEIDLTFDDAAEPQPNEEEENLIDLTQNNETLRDEKVVDLTNDFKMEIDEDAKSSQFSNSDEVIDISDEEINYSIQNVNNNDIDQEEDADVIEIDNIAEQSLFDALVQEESNDKNETKLLEEINESVKLCMDDISLKNNESNNFSSSILEILNKYKAPKEEENHRELSQKVTNEEESPIKLTQDYANEEFNSSQTDFDKNSLDDDYNFPPPAYDDIDYDSDREYTEKNNNSIRKSLDNILNSSVSKKKKSVQEKSKRKKSLGINLDDKYIIDTDSHFAEPYYSSMTPIELKKELYKFGIRPLPVKKAIELLQYIYDQTHPKIRTKSNEEIDHNDSRLAMNDTDFVANIAISNNTDEFVFQLDSNGVVNGEEYILPKSKKSKIATCLVPFHISFYNMVRSNEKYQKYILEFRPLDLDEIYKHFRKFNLRYELNDIIGFLDKRCITFKTKEQSYSKRHQKKKTKSSSASQKY